MMRTCADCGREIQSNESWEEGPKGPHHVKGSFQNLDPLSELAEKYGTDKGPSTHNYTPVYHTLLSSRREKVEKVLEIGIFRGNSLKMWSDYFPRAKIVGVDIDPKCAAIFTKAEWPRIEVIIGDAAHDPRVIRDIDIAIGRDVDLVVDDGSHLGEEIGKAFDAYFFMLRDGGLYVVEDVNLRRSASAMWVMWKHEFA
ncbi:MAG TPA: class I SAM-dependent methyltransferase [Thermoplasmata archaeon]|nr:class I SAM-dependent methyltransferase [Thermoplasmata archaeon]